MSLTPLHVLSNNFSKLLVLHFLVKIASNDEEIKPIPHEKSRFSLHK